jgi:ribosomal protein L18
MDKHITICRHLDVCGTTTYYVIEKSKNSSSILWTGNNKQAAYQVAYRNARKESTPLYDTLYKAEVDRNGVKHIIPFGNELLEVK